MSFCATQWGIKLASDKEADDFGAYLTYEVNRSTVFDTSKIREMHQIPGAGFYCQVMTMRSLGHVKDPRPAIKGSPIPILVMKGQADNQRWGYTHEYLDIFPNHRLAIIPHAGHFIYAEQPELYIRSIKDFLLVPGTPTP
jgi:proline iminopeptidase